MRVWARGLESRNELRVSWLFEVEYVAVARHVIAGEDSAIRRHFIVRVMRHLRFRSDGKHPNQFAEMGRMRTHVEYRQEVPAHRFGRRHRF